MVIISNGFSKFHLAVAAEELFRRSELSMFLTGAYPTQAIRKVLGVGPLRASKKLLRLEARRQDIDERVLVSLWFPEVLHAAALFLRGKGLGAQGAVESLNNSSFMAYGRNATKHVLKAAAMGARVYHYRAGFGHESVQAAKDAGMVTICDHSAVHPAVIECLVANNGILPEKGVKPVINRFWNLILHDIEQADFVLFNSDFVEKTFLHQGWSTDRMKVIYLGVDEQFLQGINEAAVIFNKFSGPLNISFAGRFNVWKGANILVETLQALSDVKWQLTIAGGASTELQKSHRTFLNDARVEYKGLLSRRELAACMKKAEVFVFPSLAEGSARVVFEALAAGCYVITTPNSGSIVEDGVHGCLVPPGDVEALVSAIRYAYENREIVRRIGEQNARLIQSEYRQVHYGDKLVALYRQVLKENK